MLRKPEPLPVFPAHWPCDICRRPGAVSIESDALFRRTASLIVKMWLASIPGGAVSLCEKHARHGRIIPPVSTPR